MPTPSEVISDHRKHYLDRKLARSPLLHFFPGAYRIDINSLFEGIHANLPATAGVTGVSTPASLLDNILGNRLDANIHSVRPAMLKKLERIQKAAADSKHSTGQHTLYVGYPCLVLPVLSGKAKLAPVFLFAVQIELTTQKITIKRVVETAPDGSKTPSDAIFNRLLAAYINLKHGILLGADKHKLELAGTDIENEIGNIFSSWINCKHQFHYPDVSPVADSHHFNHLNLDSDDPYIADHAILGLAEFSGQAMLDDLDKIIKMLDDGTACPEALACLIRPAKENPNNEAIEPAGDYSKWLVEKSDPSQEKVIWAHKANTFTVLQGPPGTGKSQTIVNIVADALAQKKTVLVVCQKRAAIEVVHKRLTANGLGDLAVLIDDVDKDRLSVIKRIDQITSEFHVAFSDRDRKKVSITINSDENKIDKGIEALNDNKADARIRFSDIKTLLKKLSFSKGSDDWTPGIKRAVEDYLRGGVDRNDLDRLIEETKKIDATVTRLRYGENLWSKASDALANDPQKIDNTINEVQTVFELSQGFAAGDIALQHHQETQWIAGHPWMHGSESPFQANALLTSEKSRAQFSKFKQWLKAVRAIETIIPKGNNSHKLIKALLDNTLDVANFCKLKDDVTDLRGLVTLRREIVNHPLWSVADKELKHKRGRWTSEIHGLILHNWLRDVYRQQQDGFMHVPRIPELTQSLSTLLSRKRALDALSILSEFKSRIAARDELKNRNLLRLRSQAGVPKTSLRSLYTNGLSELKNISPLLLVSPETASSMLPLTPGLFDIVVIDEASQMFVAEAMPILFRAKRVIIAGDNHQMPPGDFFSYSDDEDQNFQDDDTDDTQNEIQPNVAAHGIYRLLEAAENALPNRAHSNKLSLMVHYRSSRRELIDFSNHAFYDGKLTIPSGNAALPSFMRTAIEFEEVGGSFISGLNEAEGKRIVEILRGIWAIPEDSRPSVGVIVVNVKQRDRIIELLQVAAESDASFRRALEQESERRRDGEDASFFVRSVEHVQGDERDMIIFALTYSGSSRSFGPMKDKEDGRKRLNVAITRSKRGMIVLSSLNIDHISNLAEKGTHERYYIWQYLRYARAVAQNNLDAKEAILNQLNEERIVRKIGFDTTDSPFEDDVKQFIESEGFYVDCQVGESGFRIDLGVRSSRNSPVYLCGIECDGARYHSGWKARTNDVWRQEILESKGWSIIRIWSTDWFDLPDTAKQILSERLNNLREIADAEKSGVHHTFIRHQTAVTAKPPTEEVDVSVHSKISPHQPVVSSLQTNFDVVEVGDTVTYKPCLSG